MTTEQLIRRFHEYAQLPVETAIDSDSLIGFFQVFRPDGHALDGLFEEIDCGAQLHQRLNELYATAGNDRRPQGGRDVYFLVRKPAPVDPVDAKILVGQWLTKLRELAIAVDDQPLAEQLETLPEIRVLEGKAPKHPKNEEEKSNLLKRMQTNAVEVVEKIGSPDPSAQPLRQAYYFIACDAMLRDYLMWPLYAKSVDVVEPFAEYFQLWKHGAKFRYFNDRQLDVYLPRHV